MAFRRVAFIFFYNMAVVGFCRGRNVCVFFFHFGSVFYGWTLDRSGGEMRKRLLLQKQIESTRLIHFYVLGDVERGLDQCGRA